MESIKSNEIVKSKEREKIKTTKSNKTGDTGETESEKNPQKQPTVSIK